MAKSYRKTVTTEEYELQVTPEPKPRLFSVDTAPKETHPLLMPACRNFVRGLDLPPAPRTRSRAAAEIEDDKEAAYTVNSSLMSFVSGVSAQAKSDALNSTLLAELAANKQFDKLKQTKEWYEFYANVMANVGWPSESFQFTEVGLSGASIEVDKVITDVLMAALTENEVAILKAAIEAQKELSENDERFVLFESNSHSDTQGNFRIGIASEVGGVLTMKIGAFQFTSTETVDRLFFFKWSTSTGTLFSADQQLTLNTDVYSQVRADIVNKLGDNAVNFVLSLDI